MIEALKQAITDALLCLAADDVDGAKRRLRATLRLAGGRPPTDPEIDRKRVAKP